MIEMWVNGLGIQAEDHWTILEACRFYGIDIPTLCYMEGLSPAAVCRLCTVEIEKAGKSRLVTSCNYPVEDGLVVRTHSARVVGIRRTLIESMLARCPSSKKLQDLASKMGVRGVRFKLEDVGCILCGLCVRICAEQMGAKALGYAGRGKNRRVSLSFDAKSRCRNCGACLYVCPVSELRCQGPEPPNVICGSCMSIQPLCLEEHDDVMCFIESCGSCFRKG